MNAPRIHRLAPLLGVALAACTSGGGGFFPPVSGDGGGGSDAAGTSDMSAKLGDMSGGCKKIGDPCSSGGSCCSGICNGASGTCSTCGGVDSPCELPTDCCGGLACTGGFCKMPQTCVPFGQTGCQGKTCCQGVCNGYDNKCEQCGSSSATNCSTSSDCCTSQGWSCNLSTHKCKPPCLSSGGTCASNGECCSGLVCNSHLLACAQCGTTGVQCFVDGDCCTAQSYFCDQGTKKCALKGTCTSSNNTCTSTTQCCTGLVCLTQLKVCYKCLSSGLQCGGDGDCCSGLSCQGGVCKTKMSSCKTSNTACVHAAECCQGLFCSGGVCTGAPACKPPGGTCDNTNMTGYMDCCEGANTSDCVNGKCCIDKMYQSMHPNELKCYSTADCCPNQTCDVNSGNCL